MIRSAPTPRRTRRRTLAVAGLAVASVASLLGSAPADAAAAPLVTTDGLGIRLDETAIVGPALEAIETAMQPTVDQMIRDGAVAQAPVSGYNNLLISSNLELGFDFVNAGTPGYPSGGLKVHADIQNIEIQYRKKAWWHSECGIWVRPNTGTIDASAKVDKTRLPATPLALNPISATWDDDPDVSTSGACWTYLIDDFFDSFFGSGGEESVARRIERDLNGRAQALIDDLWADNVAPVLDSVDAFGISVNQLRTDDHGLIVTANVSAANGLSLPGQPGTYDVSAAESSGATSNVNTLLATRPAGTGDAIVSVHPNVLNQYLSAYDQATGGQYGSPAVDATAIEALLLPAAVRGNYDDSEWSVRLSTTAPAYSTPAASGGAPQIQFPQATIEFVHYSDPFDPVATFTGSIGAVKLITEVRSGSTNWGPGLSAAASTLSVTRTQANADAATVPAQSSAAILPYSRAQIEGFNDTVFVPLLSLSPISIGGLNVALCTTCGRYSGDQRYTETFSIG